ncbi:MAG: T9SS type A sorting domain-containing protein [Sodaliphilus sp.]
MMKKLLTLCAIVLMAVVGRAETTFPHTLEITDAASFANWTVIDANASTSANTWGYSETNSEALYPEDKSNPANDWLISPAVYLEPGKYDVSGYVIQRSTYSFDKQAFTLTMGDAPTVEAQTTEFASESAYTSKLYKATTGSVTVTTAGNYYFGIHLTSVKYNGNCGFQKFVISKVAPVPAHITNLTATVGAAGAMSVTLNWTNPSTDTDGSPLEKFTGLKVYRGSSEIADVQGVMGENQSFTDNAITTSGTYTYSVLAYNEDGNASGDAPSVTTPWVGPDTPKPVSNLSAVADGNAVTLTFDAPTASANGGFVDYSNLTYRITRNAVVIQESFAGNSYEDTVDSFGTYTYSVQAEYAGNRSSSQSVSLQAGEGYSVPYSEPFDTQADFDLYTVINAGGSSRTWTYYSSKQLAQYWENTSNVNQWLITPPIMLEEGKTYELSFRTGLESATSSSHYKQLNVYVGTGNTVEAQTTELFGELIQSAIMTGKTAYFTAPTSGAYHFGFNVTGQSSTYAIFVDDIAVKEADVVPQPVSNFTATAAPNGELKVYLNWTNPTKAVSGVDLAHIEKVEIYRGSDLIHTCTATIPDGDESYFDDTMPTSGAYTYTAYVYVDGKKSAAAEASVAWVGYDTPSAPANAALALVDGKPVVSFNAVTTGVHGGYVPAHQMTYTITRLPDEAVVAENITDTCFTDNSVLSLANYKYSIVAKYGNLVSEATETNALILGEPLELPYETAFESADDAAIWNFYDADGDGKTWSYNASKSDLETGFNAKVGDAAFTPPFHTVQGLHKLTYTVHGYSGRYGDAYNVALAANSDFANAVNIAEYPDKDIAFSMFEERTVDFNIDVAGVYNIGFVQNSTSQWGVYVGMVKIECVVPTGITDVVAVNVPYYSRAAQTLMLAQPARVTVVAVNGAVVASAEAESQLSLAHLASGVYVATVATADGKISHVKFVK